MRLPKSFNDVTVGQYQDVFFLLTDKQTDDLEVLTRWAQVISVLSGRPIAEIEALPIPELKNAWKRIDFVLRPEVLLEKVNPLIVANGRAYKAILDASKISVSQAINIKGFQAPIEDLDFTETTVAHMDKLLASIYLPLTWKGFKYQPSKFERIASDMKKAKLSDVYGVLFFYPILLERLMSSTADYTKSQAKVIQEHMAEIQEWALETSSTKDGAGKQRSTNSAGATRSLRKNIIAGIGSGS